jgi:hypothetical protein
VAILFVSLGVPFHQTDDRSSFRFGSMIKGFDVFNDLKTFKVGSEALESPQEPQAQEFRKFGSGLQLHRHGDVSWLPHNHTP